MVINYKWDSEGSTVRFCSLKPRESVRDADMPFAEAGFFHFHGSTLSGR